MNFRMIKTILGWLMLFEALFLVLPTVTALIYGERAVWSFLVTIAVCLAIGSFFTFTFKAEKTALYAREGFIIVPLSWLLMSLVGALPFTVSGAIPSYLDAIFETVSGFTTTGSTILGEIASLPRSILLWRSFTHWIGGMGVLVFIMAFVPLSGGQNLHIMRAETPGPSVSKLVPRVKTTALILYSLYLGLTVVELISLLFGGMSFFDALTTSFSTAGTGGFAVRNDSMASYSPAIQIIVTVFMLAFSVNFNCYYLILKRKFRESLTSETVAFFAIVLGAVGVITINTMTAGETLFASWGEAIRHAFFNVSAVMSTTGFGTVDFTRWPMLSQSVLFLLMFVGACAGSTGGGIKISRIMILIKSVGREIGNIIHPKQVRRVTIDGKPVEDSVVSSANVYIVMYLILFALSLGLLSFGTTDFTTNITAVATTMNNVGPGLGSLIGPTGNFACFSAFSKIVLIFDMLAGRLEILPMVILFSPVTWKK